MGLFGMGKPKEVDPAVLKTKTEAMLKRKETLDAVLKTKSLPVTTARVVFVFDESGSMEPFFNNGTMQNLTERLMPIAISFDDNGEMECYGFSNDWQQHISASQQNFADFINAHVRKKIRWGGTNYAPIIREITRQYAQAEPSKDPTFVIFQTDGDNFDKRDTVDAITEASRYNIFWKFVGIGTARKDFLEQLDDMEGRTVDNANFMDVADINQMSDQDLYQNLMEEYDVWQNAAKAKGIL